MKKRNLKLYVYTDVSMLLIAKIVAYNIRDNISELSKLNPKVSLRLTASFFTDQFFANCGQKGLWEEVQKEK